MPTFGMARCLCVLLTCVVAAAALALPTGAPAKMPGTFDALLAGSGNAFTRIHAPVPSVTRAPMPTIINVTYHGFTPEAQVAFQYAVDIWKTQVYSTVPITIDATWAALDTTVLGQSCPSAIYMNYASFPQSNCWYSAALANALEGKDLDTTDVDIKITFNSAFAHWYFGTDANPPTGTYDFVTVVMHELCHGLGFIGSATLDADQTGSWHSGAPYIYDNYVVNGGNQRLVDENYFPNASAELGAALTTNSLYFDGAAAIARTEQQPRLYAPATWGEASYSHLDEASYPAGQRNSLMTPTLQAAEAIHDPGPMVRGILSDLGWDVIAEQASMTYALDALIRAAGDSAFSGDTIIHDDEQQTVTRTVETGAKAIYEVAVRNDGDADTYTLTVDALPSGCSIRVYNALTGGTDITNDVLDNGWTTPAPLAKNASAYLRLEVTLDAAVAGGDARLVRLTTTSTADGTKSDAVIAKTVKATLSGVSLRTNPTSGRVLVGTPVTLIATPTGGGALEYRFRAGYKYPDGIWRFTDLSSPLYQTSNTCTWTPQEARTYTLIVLVRAQGSVWYQATHTIGCQVRGPLQSVSLQTSTPTGYVNQLVTLTATAVNGVTPEYRFRAGSPNSEGIWNWIELSTPLYQTGRRCTWRPQGAGQWTLAVLVREQGSTDAWQVMCTRAYTVHAQPTGVTLQVSATSGRIGQPITLTATAVGAVAEYRFRAGYKDAEGRWHWTELLTPMYQASGTYTWTPPAAHTYILTVYVRAQGSTILYQVSASRTVYITE